jgi:hypothetical protein
MYFPFLCFCIFPISALDIRKFFGNTFFIKTTLDNIVSSQVLYSSVVSTLREEFLNENFILFNIDSIDIHNIGFLESMFVYGFIGFLFIYNMDSINTKIEKWDSFEKYYYYRKTIRHILFFLLIVSTKNIENAI